MVMANPKYINGVLGVNWAVVGTRCFNTCAQTHQLSWLRTHFHFRPAGSNQFEQHNVKFILTRTQLPPQKNANIQNNCRHPLEARSEQRLPPPILGPHIQSRWKAEMVAFVHPDMQELLQARTLLQAHTLLQTHTLLQARTCRLAPWITLKALYKLVLLNCSNCVFLSNCCPQ